MAKVRFCPDALFRCRNDSGLTKEQVGTATARTAETVALWESGRVSPPVKVLALLSTLYEVPIASFFVTVEDDDAGQ